MISQVSSGTTPDPSSSSTANAGTDKLADKDTFLKLVVAQIQNQDPLSPTDSVQFVSQLAQFSQLEQSTEIRDTVQNIYALMQGQGEGTGASQGAADGSKSNNPGTGTGATGN